MQEVPSPVRDAGLDVPVLRHEKILGVAHQCVDDSVLQNYRAGWSR
jgi:hypothetical protein